MHVYLFSGAVRCIIYQNIETQVLLIYRETLIQLKQHVLTHCVLVHANLLALNTGSDALIMVHNNRHADVNAWTAADIDPRITCLANDRATQAKDLAFYRWNYRQHPLSAVSSQRTGGAITSKTFTQKVWNNIRIVRCPGDQPSSDVTGVLGRIIGDLRSHGKYF